MGTAKGLANAYGWVTADMRRLKQNAPLRKCPDCGHANLLRGCECGTAGCRCHARRSRREPGGAE